MMAMIYSTTDTPPDEQAQVVDAGLDEYNFSVASLGDVRQLAAFATNATGTIVGGALGRTWGECCELLQLWVAKEYRGQGVGSQLLRDFEAHAKARGCRVYYLTTLSYQAPDFYRKHGYDVLAQIAGYPNGIVKYLMQRVDG